MPNRNSIPALLIAATVLERSYSQEQFHSNRLRKINDLSKNPDIQTLPPEDISDIIKSDILR